MKRVLMLAALITSCSSLILTIAAVAQETPWLGQWGAPCGGQGQVIAFSKSQLDLSGMEMMCDIRGVVGSADVYTFELSCDGYETIMSVEVSQNRLEFVKQTPGFEFDPKQYDRC